MTIFLPTSNDVPLRLTPSKFRHSAILSGSQRKMVKITITFMVRLATASRGKIGLTTVIFVRRSAVTLQRAMINLTTCNSQRAVAENQRNRSSSESKTRFQSEVIVRSCRHQNTSSQHSIQDKPIEGRIWTKHHSIRPSVRQKIGSWHMRTRPYIIIVYCATHMRRAEKKEKEDGRLGRHVRLGC